VFIARLTNKSFMFYVLLIYYPGALIQLAKNLACEWAKDGIRANAVAPNVINTPLSQSVIN